MHALDVVGRDQVGAGLGDGLAQVCVLGRVEAFLPASASAWHALRIALDAGSAARADDQVGDLLLLDDLPVDEFLDVGMVEIEDDHLGGAAGGAAAT